MPLTIGAVGSIPNLAKCKMKAVMDVEAKAELSIFLAPYSLCVYNVYYCLTCRALTTIAPPTS